MTVRKPGGLNQFYRLDQDTPDGPYVKTTRWGTSFDSANCQAACGAIAAHVQTDFTRTFTPPGIRANQYDMSGGIGLDDVNVAYGRLNVPLLLRPYAFDTADVANAVRQGRLVIADIEYRELGDYRWQAGGDFAHAIVLDSFNSNGAYVTWDPLGTAWRAIPQYVVNRALVALANHQGRSSSSLFVGLTKVRPELAVTVSYRYGGEPRSRGRYRITGSGNLLAAPLKDGAVIRRLRIGEDIQVRQTTDIGWDPKPGSDQPGPDGRWYGTADGRKWVWAQTATYIGPYTGKEAIR